MSAYIVRIGYAINHGEWPSGLAFTTFNTIYLTTSCSELEGNGRWMLHEFHHVLNQWGNGRMGAASYFADPNKWENEADASANQKLPGYSKCIGETCECK